MSQAFCDQPLVGLIERPELTCEADLGLTPVTMASTSSGRRSPKSPTTKLER
jgi:hypothetical protein